MARGAWTGNPSMAASLVAVTYPFLAFRRRWSWYCLPLLAIPLLAAFCAHASIPLAVFGVVLGAYLYQRLRVGSGDQTWLHRVSYGWGSYFWADHEGTVTV